MRASYEDVLMIRWNYALELSWPMHRHRLYVPLR
jgi:hypothetical protein